ncbi:hypothetical protein DM860_011064 [Cuscuta australis]|uniref:Uncharacterized protein n=1 Tax=Cuscuta australis TaxID=267555 RepID=A0A328E0Q5_9ASTE|nr:hypothetical protein DM860_011064 [Cuscuta australis]
MPFYFALRMKAFAGFTPGCYFFPVEETLVESEKNTKDEVLRSGNGFDLLRAMYEEVQDSEDDDEVVNEEPCTQIVEYEAPMHSETPQDLKARQKRLLKCPERFALDDLIVRRKTKRVRTEIVRVIHLGGTTMNSWVHSH